MVDLMLHYDYQVTLVHNELESMPLRKGPANFNDNCSISATVIAHIALDAADIIVATT